MSTCETHIVSTCVAHCTVIERFVAPILAHFEFMNNSRVKEIVGSSYSMEYEMYEAEQVMDSIGASTKPPWRSEF